MVSHIDSRIKKALITGGYSGLGKAFAKMLHSHGVELWCTTRDKNSVDSIEGVNCIELDLTDGKSLAPSIQDLLQTHKFDLLINNAGFGVWGYFESFADEAIEAQLDVLLHKPILLGREFLKTHSDESFCVLVNISSLASQLPMPYFSVYNSAKAGLSAWSQSLMLEYDNSPSCVIDFQLGDFKTSFNCSTQQYMGNDILRCWEKIDEHLQKAPNPICAAKVLEKALILPQNRLLYAGSFFQRVIAPFGRRLLPQKLLLKFIRNYYS